MSNPNPAVNDATPASESVTPATTSPATVADAFLRDAYVQAPTRNEVAPTGAPSWAQTPPVSWAQAPTPAPTPAPVPPVNDAEQVRQSLLRVLDTQELAKVTGLDTELLDTYSDALPLIQKIVAAQTAPLLDAIEHQKAYAFQAQEQDFIDRVGAQLSQAGYSMKSITEDPRWKHFLAAQVPGAPINYGDAIMHAHQGRNSSGVHQVFEAFIQGASIKPTTTTPTTPWNAPPSHHPAHAITPSTGGGGTAVPMTTRHDQPILKWSTYEKASEEYVRGRMPRDAFVRIKEVYDQAATAQTIDFKQ